MLRLIAMITLAGSMGLLQGCLYYRLGQTHHQLCDQIPRIAVQQLDGGGRAVLFDKPTLYDKDVACLMGADPSTIQTTVRGKLWRYVARPIGPADQRGESITVDLSFDLSRGRYRLARATLPPSLEQVFSPYLIDRSIAAACNGQLDLVSRTAQVDLSTMDPASLPNRVQVVQLLGAPNEPATSDGALSWAYCLGDCVVGDEPALMSRIDIAFDQYGHIEQVSTDYLQYYARADFSIKQALVGFRGSLAQLSWGCGF